MVFNSQPAFGNFLFVCIYHSNNMADHLSSGRVNVSLLRDDARRLLLDCLDKCPGSKVRCIIICFVKI